MKKGYQNKMTTTGEGEAPAKPRKAAAEERIPAALICVQTCDVPGLPRFHGGDEITDSDLIRRLIHNKTHFKPKEA